IQEMRRVRADVMRLADRLRREFRRRDVEEDIGAGSLQADDLRFDAGIGGLVADLLDDHRLGLAAKTIHHALDVVFAVIVILVEDADLGIGHVLAPLAMKMCGTFFWFRYLWIAVSVGVPSELKSARMLSCSMRRRVCSTVLGGL